MKLPRYSLRTVLITVAIIAAVVGYLRYKSQGGWTEARLHQLIEKEYNPKWTWAEFSEWAAKHNFESGKVDDAKGATWNIAVFEEDGANAGLLQGEVAFVMSFVRDVDRKHLGHHIQVFKAPRNNLSPSLEERIRKRSTPNTPLAD
jgi:hypothetical protein